MKSKLREIWDKRAEVHAARQMCQTQDRFTDLYNQAWWGYINECLPEKPGEKILEAGCGTSRWAERLAPLGFEIVLSDISPVMLQKAREYAEKNDFAENLSFEELDVRDMYSLKDGEFHMVVSTGEAVTLCGAPEEAISEFCRVTRPGGYVLCDAGNRYRRAYDFFRKGEFDRIMPVLKTGYYEPKEGPGHYLLGPGELKNILEERDMEVVHLAGVTPFFSFPPDRELKNGLNQDAFYSDMQELDSDFAEHPDILSLSSRLLAVARKPAA
jgi:ubiquinone/menaquinone biosynthesis C-methylase UbiE